MPSYKCKAPVPQITPYPLFLLSVLFNGITHSEALVPPTRAAPIPLPAQTKFEADAGGAAAFATATTGG
jgi:hypothetical protein